MPDLSGFSFADIEAAIAKVLDPVTTAAQLIDGVANGAENNPILKLILSEQQQEFFTEVVDDLNIVVSTLKAADALLHKTP